MAASARLTLGKAVGAGLGGGRHGAVDHDRRRAADPRRGRRGVVAAQHAQGLRLRAQVAQRGGEALLAHVAVDVGVELVLGRASQARAGVELGDVQAVLAQDRQAAPQRPGPVRDRERERGLAHPEVLGRLEVGRRSARAGSPEEHEAGDVVGVVGDVRRQLGQAVAPPGLGRGDRAARAVARRGHVARRDPGVGHRHPAHVPQPAQEAPALGQHDRVRVDLAQVVQGRAGHPEQLVLHPQGDAGEQVEVVLGQHVVALADRPGDRVVDREQAHVGLTRQHRLRHRAVRAAADRDERHPARRGVRVEDRVRVRALDSLEGGGQGQDRRRGLGGGNGTGRAHRALREAQEPLAAARGSCVGVLGGLVTAKAYRAGTLVRAYEYQ